MKIDFLTKPELLAPAGSFDCLKAAVQNGADAVYVGLKTGSARMGAENFSLSELKDAIEYAHIRGVRVYLALNTLICDDEFCQTYDLAKNAADIGVDALILQDLGLACKILENKPEFGCEVHASTQMSVYNKEGVKFLAELGFDRCITARELSLDELAELCANSPIEIEAFCHGALCMSVSGQCLMSSFIGGRSGNKGTCAQPCRKKYSLSVNGKDSTPAYRLSPADFASLPHIEELISSGVRSLKIEGRLKSPAYVAAVTRSYRKTIDSICEGKKIDITKSMRDMQVMFGRGDFTSGYLKGKLPFKDITYKSAGRVGLPIGTVTAGPTILPSPKNFPTKLTRFSIEVKLYNSDDNNNSNATANAAALKTGDGITVYTTNNSEQQKICGGTVNSVNQNHKNNTITITVAGSIYTKEKSNAPHRLALTHDSALQASIDADVATEIRRTPLIMRFEAHAGEMPTLEIIDSNGNKSQTKGTEAVQTAQKAPTGEEEIKKQLSKLGDTPFYAAEIIVEIDDNIFMPVSALNSMRRNCISAITELRKKRTVSTADKSAGTATSASHFLRSTKCFTQKNLGGGISLFFYTAKSFLQFDESKTPEILIPYMNEATTYYLPISDFASIKNKIRKIKSEKDNCNIILYFPFISMGKTVENTRRALESICNNYLGSLIDGFLCQNAGDFALISKYDTAVCCDYSFNITNLHSFNELNALGVSRATISVETQTLPKLGESGKIITPEIIIGGPIVLMRSRHCYIDEGECNGKCAKCTKAEYSLKDSMGCTFPILSQQSDCCSILLSHKPVSYTPSQVKKIRSENSKVTLRVNIL